MLARPTPVDSQARARLRRRYLSLGVGELVAAAVFCLIAALAIQPRLRGTEPSVFWVAFLPLILLLVQAGAYWLLARTWVGDGSMPASLAAVYRACRVLDVMVLVGSLLWLIVNFPGRLAVGALVIAVWSFALVEYVNYFVVRLSYPLSQWASRVGEWRTPRLVVDLSRSPRALR